MFGFSVLVFYLGFLSLSLTRYYPAKSLGAGPDAEIDEKALLEVTTSSFQTIYLHKLASYLHGL